MYFLKSDSFKYPEGDRFTVEILTAINESDFNLALSQSDICLQKLNYLKENESEAAIKNDIYIAEQFFKLLSCVARYWISILANEFSNSWIILQDILDYLRSLKKFHNKENRTASYIEKQFLALEATYPYQIFSSVGIVVDYYKCSVCGLDIDSFECAHLKGELYNGDIVYGIANEILHFDHCALVDNPLDKRCVITIDDSSEQFAVQSDLSKYIYKASITPFGFKNIEIIRFKKTNPKYVDLSRNSLCFCGSNLKFKKCCISLHRIEHKHFEFIDGRLIT